MAQGFEQRTQDGGVTGRAVAIALVLLVVLTPAAFYVEIAWNTTNVFVGAAVILRILGHYVVWARLQAGGGGGAAKKATTRAVTTREGDGHG